MAIFTALISASFLFLVSYRPLSMNSFGLAALASENIIAAADGPHGKSGAFQMMSHRLADVLN